MQAKLPHHHMRVPQQAFLLPRSHTHVSIPFPSPQQLACIFPLLTLPAPLDLAPISVRKWTQPEEKGHGR